jgi:pimeloyl-ACP methyl ester carboxylesterase
MSPIVSRHQGIDEGIPRCRFNVLGVSLVPVPIDSASTSRSLVAALWPERCQGLVSVSGYLRARHSRPRPRRARAASDSCGSRSRRGRGCREQRLAEAPAISVPTITLEGDANGAPLLSRAPIAGKSSGKYIHRTIEGGIGHNLPQEAPEAFAQAVIDVYGDAI